jgi:hypothetical protein
VRFALEGYVCGSSVLTIVVDHRSLRDRVLKKQSKIRSGGFQKKDIQIANRGVGKVLFQIGSFKCPT